MNTSLFLFSPSPEEETTKKTPEEGGLVDILLRKSFQFYQILVSWGQFNKEIQVYFTSQL